MKRSKEINQLEKDEIDVFVTSRLNELQSENSDEVESDLLRRIQDSPGNISLVP